MSANAHAVAGLRAFHGSPHDFDVRELKRVSHGSFGAGYYFCGDPEHALIYSGEDAGACVLVAELEVARPYVHLVREPFEVDCWGEGLVIDLFPQAVSRKLVDRVLMNECYFGAEIGIELGARGHDALVARFEDGSSEIVVFNASQIRLPEHAQRNEIVLRPAAIKERARQHQAFRSFRERAHGI